MENKSSDRYGNPYSLDAREDGRVKRTIQTNRTSAFEFLGNVYSYDILTNAQVLMVYEDQSHLLCQLVKDQYGRLFLYSCEEDFNFDGGPDREDHVWTLVTDMEDADKLSLTSRFGRLREPFVAADENNWMAAHEYIQEEFRSAQTDKAPWYVRLIRKN